ncbi:hypothetical protein NLG97_g10370 [Lecanicillium saksenae]|uniref:Uncharacterized protein n=1 Tax=Lecanicillium saksenae TaxID=468837 RepID=A0ACC1QGE1_9HYPO|nr:hypothetical protein NLG97_g10370 [Lecanicillium saksenae]
MSTALVASSIMTTFFRESIALTRHRIWRWPWDRFAPPSLTANERSWLSGAVLFSSSVLVAVAVPEKNLYWRSEAASSSSEWDPSGWSFASCHPYVASLLQAPPVSTFMSSDDNSKGHLGLTNLEMGISNAQIMCVMSEIRSSSQRKMATGKISPMVHLWLRGWYITITREEAKNAFGRHFERYYDPQREGYTAGFDMFHTLHCLNHVRMLLYSYVFPSQHAHAMDVLSDATVHPNHCIEQIRQYIMCLGDMTPIPTVFFPSRNASHVESDLVHTCRNFQLLQDWLVGRLLVSRVGSQFSNEIIRDFMMASSRTSESYANYRFLLPQGVGETEEVENYRIGGFHPVALKICDASRSPVTAEKLAMIRSLLQDGNVLTAVVLPLRQFNLDGPNGQHLVLVLPFLGPSLSELSYQWESRLTPEFARKLAYKATQAVAALHAYVTPFNFLLRLQNTDKMDEEDLYRSQVRRQAQCCRLRLSFWRQKWQSPFDVNDPASVVAYIIHMLRKDMPLASEITLWDQRGMPTADASEGMPLMPYPEEEERSLRQYLYQTWDRPEGNIASTGMAPQRQNRRSSPDRTPFDPSWVGMAWNPCDVIVDGMHLGGYGDDWEEILEVLPKITEHEVDLLFDLLSKVFVYEPENRPTAAELLEHPWFHLDGQQE